jgi:DNA-binding response OmpR family regulator
MQTEQPNAAFARPVDQLDVVIIDDSKSMQSILRSMLHAMKVARVRVFDNPSVALEAMLVDPPHLVILDWLMDPIDGISLLKAMRTTRMGSLAIVPAIVLTGSPTVRLVEMAVKAGAHFILAKPVSPATLQQRIMAICNDRRPFIHDQAHDIWELDGANAILAAHRSRRQQYRTMQDGYVKLAREHLPAMPVPPKVMPSKAKPKPESVTAEAKEPAKLPPIPDLRAKAAPRKAVGFGARRVATPPGETPRPT